MAKAGIKMCTTPIKKWFQDLKQTENAHYPCLCETVGPVLFWNRLLGILPVVAIKTRSHVCCCKFKVSKGWMVYSYVLQAIYIPFVITTAGLRMSCGPQHESSGSEWYVMTFGYFIADLDSAITLVVGAVYAKDICKILEKLTTICGLIGELRRLRKTMQIAMFFTLGSFTAVFLSFAYVAWLRTYSQSQMNLTCHILDKPFGVTIRGLALIFPGVYISLVVLLCLLVSNKYQGLGDRTMLTLEANIKTVDPDSEVATSIEENIPSATNQGQLNQLAETHRKVTACLNQINKCVGLQVLSEVSANIYTIVYYLYRYSTATNEKLTSNARERWHYIIALSYRIAKLLTYLILGHAVSTSAFPCAFALMTSRKTGAYDAVFEKIRNIVPEFSPKLIMSDFEMPLVKSLGKIFPTARKTGCFFHYCQSNRPLEALQRARIINLPTRLQQQVQSLILQWSGKKMALSAFGVVNVGPWLVAPIVGNVITYLLVALQFETDTTNGLSANVTAILETIF